jgi:hypothetical protein
MSKDESCAFECTVKAITSKAALVEIQDVDIWLPLSQMDYVVDELVVGGELTVSIPYWLAERKGL